MNAHRLHFVSWDGPGARHLQGLFLPILERLCEISGFPAPVVVQGCRPGTPGAAAGRPGVTTFHTPTGPGWTLPARLLLVCWNMRRLLRRQVAEYDVVIARSVVPGVIVASLGIPFIYDSDGHIAEQRKEARGWSSNHPLYRCITWMEKTLARRADVVLVRTAWARSDIAARASRSANDVHVVTNGRDSTQFRPADSAARLAIRQRFGLPHDSRIVVYAGSAAPRQCPERIARILGRVVENETWYGLVLTPDRETFADLIRGLPGRDRIVIGEVDPSEVATALGAADVGIALQESTYAARSVAVTKLGEYLLCDLPVILDCHASPAAAGLFRAGAAVDARNLPGDLAETLEHLASDDARKAAGIASLDFTIERAATEYLAAVRHSRIVRGRDGRAR